MRALFPEPVKYDQIPNGCLVACLAGLTGIPRERLERHVPADQSFLNDDEKWKAYYGAVIDELHAHGWAYVCTGGRIPRGFSIGVGRGPNGVDHACIVYDGTLWHDPNAANGHAGVERFAYFELVVPIVGTV